MPKPINTAKTLRSAIRALAAAAPLVDDKTAIDAAVKVLLDEVGKLPVPRRGALSRRLPEAVLTELRDRLKAGTVKAIAEQTGLAEVTIARISATGSASFLSAAALKRAFGMLDHDDVAGVEFDDDGLIEDDLIEAWDLAEARAALLGIEGHAAIIKAVGSSSASALLAWATRPLDILGGEQ